MKKHNLVMMLLLIFGTCLASANNIEGEVYKDINIMVSEVFNDLEKIDGITDNGYFHSTIEFSLKPLNYEEEILTEEELIEHFKQSLFTVFAYVDLSDAQKTRGAKNLLKKIRSKFGNDFRYFKSLRGSNINSISLTESCKIGGPKEEIYLKYKYSNNVAMMIKSDICD